MKKLFLLVLLPLAMSIVSCEKDDDGGITPNNPKGVPITSSADVQSYHSVVLKGYANGAKGKVGFCYSATEADPDPYTCPYIETSTIKSDQSYELTVDGLKPNTKYYYRAFGSKDMTWGGAKAKDVKTFTTDKFKVEAVDLGLSVKWANCNVGASALEEYGDYFAWGETGPYYTKGHSQDSPCSNWKSGKSNGYDWSSYMYCHGSSNTLTKYCVWPRHGTVDNKTVLDAADDAAAVNWGGSWRMPTMDEYEELCDNCTWIWTLRNDVWGYEVVGLNGNYIFLPAAGYRSGSYLNLEGYDGYYWSSSLDASDSNDAHYLLVGRSKHSCYSRVRHCGHSVRPVCK